MSEHFLVFVSCSAQIYYVYVYVPGDLVIADRGFTCSDAAKMVLAEVKVPPFTKGKKQLEKQEIDWSQWSESMLNVSLPSLLESNKMKKLVKSAMEKSHLEPANNESTLQSTSDSQFTSINGVTTEPSVMDCSSAATQGNDLVAVDDIVCSPPKKRCKAYDDEGIIMGSELTDMEINFAQQLLKAQFTSINGLESTLHQQLQKNATVLSKDSIRNRIQILFCQERNIG